MFVDWLTARRMRAITTGWSGVRSSFLRITRRRGLRWRFGFVATQSDFCRSVIVFLVVSLSVAFFNFVTLHSRCCNVWILHTNRTRAAQWPSWSSENNKKQTNISQDEPLFKEICLHGEGKWTYLFFRRNGKQPWYSSGGGRSSRRSGDGPPSSAHWFNSL